MSADKTTPSINLNKRYPAPDSSPVDSIVAQCTPGLRVLPTRFALTTQTLKSLSSTGKAPSSTLKQVQANSEYDIRLLRDGYVYILALSATTAYAEITTNAPASNDDCNAWYVYRYHSPDMEINDGSEDIPLPYHFNQYFGEPNSWKLSKIGNPYITLPENVTNFYILYSDIKLPQALLTQLEKDKTTRNEWMHYVNTKQSDTFVNSLKLLDSAIQDFIEVTSKVDDETNAYRLTPIGYHSDYDNLIKRIWCNNGIIVALDDPIGTARDMSIYHYYLVQQRNKLLRKYQYAFATAQHIDAYVKQQYFYQYQQFEKENSSPSASFGTVTQKPSVRAIYQRLGIAEQHLTPNGNAEILATLKTEFNLDEELIGINTINKLANLIGRYGQDFKELVNAWVTFIAKPEVLNRVRRIEQCLTNTDTHTAELWCLWQHGLLCGLDLSAFGANAMIAALEESDVNLPLPTQAQFEPDNGKALRDLTLNYDKVIALLANVAEKVAFNVAAYDLFVDIWADKVMYSKIRKGNKSPKRPKLVYSSLVAVFQAHPSAKEIYGQNIGKLPSSGRSFAFGEIHAKLTEPSYRLFQVTETLSGVTKLSRYAPLLTYFNDNTARTSAGQLANDPTLNSLYMLTAFYSPEGGLGAQAKQAVETFRQQASISSVTGEIDIINATKSGRQGLMVLKTTLLSATLAITAVGALFEYGIWQEARYKGDTVGMLSAGLRGGGMLIVELGGALVAAAKVSSISALVVGVAYAGLALGAVAVIAGIILALYSSDDMETWVTNGFWGDSELYWGEIDLNTLYGWKGGRDEKFKTQFDSGVFLADETNNYYQLEMQRYYQFAQQIEINVIDKYTFEVSHYLLQYPSIAEKVIVNTFMLNDFGAKYFEQPQHIILDTANQKVTLQYPKGNGYNTRITHTSENDSFDLSNQIIYYPDRSIKKIHIQVSMPDFEGSKTRIKSVLTTFKF
ncbi:toxin VasX [Actinobacillus vicugnae]|uniref:toxin VasX n=1 Tax=Actinobacillus vicugnae TaxID=2573093 RepID=UPI001241F2A8|nr:toxin VasX [Actinobacillus vicugnae]